MIFDKRILIEIQLNDVILIEIKLDKLISIQILN